MKKENIFDNIPNNLKKEFFEDIVVGKGIKIEKIVSKGHTTPEDEWYDQDMNEWVIVLKGEAILQFEHEQIYLKSGEYIQIPKHTKHKVSWTKQEEETIWLAVFY
jgi:cupin 2 domain-containing protein